MKERHLRLIVSHNVRDNKENWLTEYLKILKNNIKSLQVSKTEKIYVLKDILLKIYRDYEITTGIVDIPCFIRAQTMLDKIIKENKVDYYYKILSKFRKRNFYN